jgi:hypothetical protein
MTPLILFLVVLALGVARYVTFGLSERRGDFANPIGSILQTWLPPSDGRSVAVDGEGRRLAFARASENPRKPR